MSTLLEKARKITRTVQMMSGSTDQGRAKASLVRVSTTLAESLESEVFVVDGEGKLVVAENTCPECQPVLDRENDLEPICLYGYYARLVGDAVNTLSNVEPEETDGHCVIDSAGRCAEIRRFLTVVPIQGGGDRLGTLVLVKLDNVFGDDDLLLAEYAATAVGIELLRERNRMREEEAWKRSAVRAALRTLSYSELGAIQEIFNEIQGDEGLLVASKIADRLGVTRSVIISALRKFESAGVLRCNSLGTKGTHIRVLNKHLLKELESFEA